MFPGSGVTAVDPLLDKYERELSIFSKNDYPDVKFITSPIESFTTTQTYDYVFCMNAINHVSDIQAGFATLCSLAKPQGKIVVSIDAHNRQFLKGIFRIGPGDVLHPHQYDLQEYKGFLEHEGYEVVKTICLDKAFIFNHYILIAQRKKG